ncbi:MAG: phytanoyl-CoA dioxygenase family protein [Ignavibacteriales bacterium]|nr:phytanoyl-CoA dioxygenase family protein [Ignavibacteriales bacterium]
MNEKYYIPQSFIRDSVAQTKIIEDGFAILGNIGQNLVNEFQNEYKRLHKIRSSDGAMFYSIYSQDIEYRKEVHNKIQSILSSKLDLFLEKDKYKNVINSFIVKFPGKKSEFALHQDSSIVDESKYSQLSLWIPLQDTTIDNGTLCVVPKTHKLFSPYRDISMVSPFASYEDELRKYLVPIELKAGDILAFDYRLVHYSPANLSDKERVVVLSGVFEKDAKIEVVYQESKERPLEVYSQSDDYLITHKGFQTACGCKPERGEKIREILDYNFSYSREDFENFVMINQLKKTNIPILQKNDLDSYTIIDANFQASIKDILKSKVDKIFK